MSNRILEERIATLEREIAELKALLGATNGLNRRQNGAVFAAPLYRERRESARALREAERELF